jgi:hypothetical protein
MRINQSMKLLLNNADVNFLKSSALDNIVDNGFVFFQDCILLKQFFSHSKNENIANNFFDKVEFEWHFNSIEISNYCKNFYLENSIYFLKKCLANVHSIEENSNLTAICSINTNENISIKAGFYKNRPNEQKWLDDDIENYDEAVMEFDSHSVNLLPI